MVSRRAYRRVSVNEIDREQLLKLAKEHGKGTLWPFATLSEHEQILRLWGKKYLKEEKIAALVLSARTTKGLPMNASEISWMQELAAESLRCHREQLACDKIIQERVASDPVMQRYSDTVGAATLAVLWSEVGDPVAYSSAGAYVKALGLNLKERSSGKRLGQLAISKRGPAMSRRWLFFWALRAIQRDELKGWYEAFIQVGNGSSSGEHRKMKGLIAMMRKLCKSLWHARVHNKDFDYSLVISDKPPRRRRRRSKACEKGGMTKTSSKTFL